MTDPLMQAYYTLIKQTEIPDVKIYAEQLEQLAKLFLENGRLSMAETCQSRSNQYQQLSEFIPAVRRVPMGKSFVKLESYEPETVTPA